MPLLRVTQTSSWWSHTVMSRQSKFRYVIETSHCWMHSTTCRFRWPYRLSCGGVGGGGRKLHFDQPKRSSAMNRVSGTPAGCVRHGSRDLPIRRLLLITTPLDAASRGLGGGLAVGHAPIDLPDRPATSGLTRSIRPTCPGLALASCRAQRLRGAPVGP